MAYERAKTGFEGYGDLALLAKGDYIHSQTSSHTSLFPEPTPTMPELLAICDEFRSALSSSQTGNHVSREQKDQIRAELIAKLNRLATYVDGVADGDALVIMKAGFDVAKPRERIETVPPETPEASYTGQPRELMMKVPAVKGVRTYEWQHTTDPERKTWEREVTTTSRTVLEDLTPGQTYYIRVKVLGARKQVKYSDWITKMVY